MGAVLTDDDLEREIARRTEIPENDYHTSALEKMDLTLTELLQFTEQTRTLLFELPTEDWRYSHRTSGEQTRMEVGLYERALDRASRVLKDVSKMALQEKITSLGKAQTELMIRIMMAVVMEMGLDSEGVTRARSILLRKFQDEANLSSRVEEKVTMELEGGMVIDAS